MRNRLKSPLNGFSQLPPIIQALLIVRVLLVIMLIYLNPAVVSAIVAFLLALRHFVGVDSGDRSPPTIREPPGPATK